MNSIPWYKKYLGYLVPITTTRYSSEKHPNLKIKYYQGQWQLESKDALYSDGYRYAPFRIALDWLHKKEKLQSTKNFLLLGAGLGSALLRLQKVYDLYPSATLVEYDQEIIELGQSYFSLNSKKNVSYVHTDALSYLKNHKQKYDLIGVDIFNGITNSALITQDSFLQSLAKVCNSDSHIILNTIFNKNEERTIFESKLQQFYSFERLERIPNYIYILQLKK